MRSLACFLLAVASAACEEAYVTSWSRPVVAPDGGRAFSIGCYDPVECDDLAGQSCPRGYRVLRSADDREFEASTVGTANRSFSVERSQIDAYHVVHVLVECREPITVTVTSSRSR